MAQEFKARHTVVLLAVVLGCLLLTGAAAAQEPGSGYDGSWHYEVDLFLWGTSLNGSTGPAVREYQVDMSFGDIAEVLDFAAVGSFSARKDRWGFTFDTFYANLGDSVDNPFGNPVELDLEDFITDAAGTYRAYQSERASCDLIFGLRYNDVKVGLEPFSLAARQKGVSWTDPIVGVTGGVKMSERWTFGYRADIGGFGAGSDLTWLGALRFDARVSKRCFLGLGYIGYSVDYTKGSGSGEFVYDMDMYGPYLGVGWKW